MTSPQPASVEVDGDQLRTLRKLRGETLETFAERCGITFQYLSQIERGNRPNVSPPTYVKICDALGLDEKDRPKLMARSAA